jgi:uncharacterized protein
VRRSASASRDSGGWLELAPFGKFLYSSDAFGLPKLYYLAAVLFRTALSGFLTAGLEEDHYSERTVVRLTGRLAPTTPSAPTNWPIRCKSQM